MSDVTVVDPKVTPPAPAVPAATPPTPVAEAATPTPAPPAPAEPPLNPKSPKWALDRISEESAGRREAAAQAAREKARADAAEELLRRMQSGQPPAVAPAQAAPRIFQTPTADTIPQAAIEAAAARQRLAEDAQELGLKGARQFGNDSFAGTINTMTALGMTDEFIADVLAVDKPNAHALLHTMASDPEKAAMLTKMPSRQRIAEITRMSLAAGGTPQTATPAATTPALPARTVSQAPAPPPAIQQGATQVTEKHWYDDDVDGADCDAIFFDKARLDQRAGRARR